jgi:hypothetical protein
MANVTTAEPMEGTNSINLLYLFGGHLLYLLSPSSHGSHATTGRSSTGFTKGFPREHFFATRLVEPMYEFARALRFAGVMGLIIGALGILILVW